MCLLTFMNEGTTASIDDLSVGAINNPDGFGFAIHAGNKVIRKSGLNFDAVLDEFLKERAKHSGPALFHSRITTHGGTNLGNCHPFQVGRDTSTVVAHNGMLPIKEANGKSDTRIFAEHLFPSWGGVRTLDSRKMRKKLSKFADGSKLVFLTADRNASQDFYIINEKLGHWVDGIWWSNSSYKWSRYSYSGSGMYTTGWSRADSSSAIAAKYINDAGHYTLGSTTRSGGAVYDCSFVDRDGTEVWGELWECANCAHQEYFDDENIDTADCCYVCDTCWFCGYDRILCQCYGAQFDFRENGEFVAVGTSNTGEVLYQHATALSKPGYDSMCDIDQEGY